nr:MAG TPA: hypothetical protein [Bacteriophage sp.]
MGGSFEIGLRLNQTLDCIFDILQRFSLLLS